MPRWSWQMRRLPAPRWVIPCGGLIPSRFGEYELTARYVRIWDIIGDELYLFHSIQSLVWSLCAHQEVSDRAMADVRSPSQLGLRRIPMVGILTVAITHRTRRQGKTSRLYLTGSKYALLRLEYNWNGTDCVWPGGAGRRGRWGELRCSVSIRNVWQWDAYTNPYITLHLHQPSVYDDPLEY